MAVSRENKSPIFATNEELVAYEEQFYGKTKHISDEVDDFYYQLYNEQVADNTSLTQKEIESAREFEGNNPVKPTRPKTKQGRKERLERNRKYRKEEKLRKRRQEGSAYVADLKSKNTKAKVEAEKNGTSFKEESLFNTRKRERLERQTEQRTLIDDDALAMRAKKSFFNTKGGKIATAIALGAIAIANRGKRRRLEQKRLNNAEMNRKRLEQESQIKMTPDMYKEEALQTAQEIMIQDTAPAQQKYAQYYDTTSAQLAASISQYRYGAKMPGYMT